MWPNYTVGDGFGYRLGLSFQTWWLHCTMQNMFTLHRLDSDPYFCTGQEYEFESAPVSESGNVFKPLRTPLLAWQFLQSEINWDIFRVPTRTGKPGKMGRHFPVREKSGNFEQTGKVREKSGKITQNTGKLREFQTNIIFYFLVIFKLTVYYFAEMHQIFSYKINF